MELLLNNLPVVEHAALTEWQAVELSCSPPAGAVLTLSIGDTQLEPFLRPADPAWRWRWNPQNAVGSFLVELHARWPDGQHERQVYRIEVLPRKLDSERYRLLLEELEATAWQVLLALQGPGLAASVGALGVPEPAEAIAALFGERFPPFVAAVERLTRRPPSRLQATMQQVQPGLARDFSQVGARPGRLDPAATSEQGNMERPERFVQQFISIAQPGSNPTYDTYEYRLLVRLLGSLRARASQLLQTAGLSSRTVEQLHHAREQLQTLRSMPALANVGPLRAFQGPTPLMQRDSDFRTVYRMWQSLRRHGQLALESPLFSLPMEELPRLYECWCAITLAQALLQLPGWQLRAQHLMSGENEQISFDLRSEGPLLELVRSTGERLYLWYQPRYTPLPANKRQTAIGSLDRHTRVPDMVIELQRPGSAPSLLIFDAKYRLEASGSLPEAALADGYVYLGSIGDGQGRRVGQSVWLLYPGEGAEERYPSGVGALPFLPGRAGIVPWLASMLTSIDDSTEEPGRANPR
jgi:hypothetical protein